MNFRKVTENDISIVVEMIAGDELGKQRENFQKPLPNTYLKAYEKINSDKNQELIVVDFVKPYLSFGEMLLLAGQQSEQVMGKLFEGLEMYCTDGQKQTLEKKIHRLTLILFVGFRWSCEAQ